MDAHEKSETQSINHEGCGTSGLWLVGFMENVIFV